MIISHRWQFVYLGPPKTASTTLHRWLSQPAFCESRWTPERQDQHSVTIPAACRHYFTFASLRDELDRTVSLWRHSQSPGELARGWTHPMDFREFVEEFQPYASWFFRAVPAELLAPVRLDAVVRFERLERDLVNLPPLAAAIAAAVAAGRRLEPLKHLNRTRHAPWATYYTPALREQVEYRVREAGGWSL